MAGGDHRAAGRAGRVLRDDSGDSRDSGECSGHRSGPGGRTEAVLVPPGVPRASRTPGAARPSPDPRLFRRRPRRGRRHRHDPRHPASAEHLPATGRGPRQAVRLRLGLPHPHAVLVALLGPSPSNTARPSNSPPPAASQAADSGAQGEGVQDDSGGAAADSDSGGNDGSAGSGTSGRDTDGATDSGTGAAAPTGYFQLKNAYNGRCLDGSQGTYGVRFGGCSDSPAMSWAYRNGSGGTYQLVNEYSGQCLTASVGNVTSTGKCDGSAQQSWRTGSGGTLQSTYNSLCLDESAGWPSAATCESGKVSQRWTKL
ncbi:RICIN domain-containing protein [Streptomyces sp. PSKA30]|uniref:RICIN domain-containing protein n=1 Tax=Streptomyces sp. PSKA30 TaxID=2874597 RepID=UPI0027E0ED87|nr:RICIN domain-containing protein [Streptomyces sp. PSKA30]